MVKILPINRKITGLFFALVFISHVLAASLYAAPLRSIDDLFPSLTQNQKRLAISGEGLKHSFEKTGSPLLTPAPNLGIDLRRVVMEKNPSHIVEALVLVPYNGKELGRLDAYNAIGRIKNIKDHLYSTGAQNKGTVIFKETTRLESAGKKTPISDPPPSNRIPFSETVYLRFDDASYGTLYLRGDISTNLYGLTYTMTNFEAVRFLFFTIMKAEKFSAVVYIEPVEEGILVYGMSGIDVPGFIAGLINISSDIEKRLTVLVYWLTDGLRRQL